LAEGRVFRWPDDAAIACDFARIAELGKAEAIDLLLNDDRLINSPPYLARTVDVEVLRTSYRARTLTLKDFYQDWVKWSPASRYKRFMSVPVPLEPESRERAVSEYGVFNIDTFDDEPLLDERILQDLRVATAFVVSAYVAAAPE
jgi:hypothetical protein